MNKIFMAKEKPQEMLASLPSRESVIPFTVPPDCVDNNGHVNYISITKIFSDAHGDFMAKHGFSLGMLRDRYGLALYVRKVDLDCEAEILPGTKGEIVTMAAPGETSINYAQTIRDESGKVFARANFVVVAVSQNDRKPVPLPDAIREALVTGGFVL